jgi:hypothetical protein
MSWIKAADLMPPENEPILIHDDRNSKLEFGRHINGRWYAENTRDGQLREIAEVAHWAWILESETYDSGDD